jgi:hypothetical protein
MPGRGLREYLGRSRQQIALSLRLAANAASVLSGRGPCACRAEDQGRGRGGKDVGRVAMRHLEARMAERGLTFAETS